MPAMAYLGFTLWSLGEIDRAIALVERMRERVAGLTHANTLALGAVHAVVFELMRRDRSRVRLDVSNLVRIVREHDLRLFRAFGVFFEGWAMADAGAQAEGLEGMRRGAENLREQKALVFDARVKIALAEAEAQAGDPERALAVLDEALATAERAGYRAFEADLARLAAKFCSSATPPIPQAPRKRSKPRSMSPSNKARAASACARRSRSPRYIDRPAVPPTPTPSSRLRSKASRQRRKCPRLPRRRRCWRRFKTSMRSGPTWRSGGE